MDFKKIFAIHSDTSKQPARLTAENGYRLARLIRFLPLMLMAIEIYFHHYLYFKGTISGSLLGTNNYQSFPNDAGHVIVGTNKYMEISLRFHNWSDLFEPLYFLHVVCINMKYIILFFVGSEIAKLFKSISEKRLFEDRNISVLRLIGVSLILIPIFDNLAINIMTRYVQFHPELFSELKLFLNTRLNLFPSGSMSYFIVGQIIYLFMVEIFRHGLELKSENDLTV